MSRRRVGIPEPDLNLDALLATVIALKEEVEVLRASRGPTAQSAATFQDLINLNLIQESDLAQLAAIERQRGG